MENTRNEYLISFKLCHADSLSPAQGTNHPCTQSIHIAYAACLFIIYYSHLLDISLRGITVKHSLSSVLTLVTVSLLFNVLCLILQAFYYLRSPQDSESTKLKYFEKTTCPYMLRGLEVCAI